jgi:hypothetical protein
MSMKNSNAPSGVEPATFRLVAQYLNQLRYSGTSTVLFLIMLLKSDL